MERVLKLLYFFVMEGPALRTKVLEYKQLGEKLHGEVREGELCQERRAAGTRRCLQSRGTKKPGPGKKRGWKALES